MSIFSNMIQRDKLLIAGLGMLLALLASYSLIINPKISQFNVARTEFEKELNAYETDKNYLKRLKELEKRFELTEIEIIKTKKALPDDFEMASLIVEIDNIFHDSGIDIESIKPESPVEEGKLRKQSIDVVVAHESSMYRLLSALRRLESSGRYMKISGIDSSVKVNEEEEEILQTNIRLNVYSLLGSDTKKDESNDSSDKSREQKDGT